MYLLACQVRNTVGNLNLCCYIPDIHAQQQLPHFVGQPRNICNVGNAKPARILPVLIGR